MEFFFKLFSEELTKENKEFIQEVIKEKYPAPDIGFGSFSPLKLKTVESAVQWEPKFQRVGLIARKIGIYPMWMKNGKRVSTTLFQVIYKCIA